MAEQKREFQLEPHDLLLSAATVPLLGVLIVGRAVSDVMMSLSQVSEEVFRGDRLPILRFTQPHESKDTL